MFAVIFEVRPKKERFDDYLALARYLKPKLEAIDGFLDNERFESKWSKGRLLSLSIWRDEKALVRWRTRGEHHGAQETGRFEIFQDYRLRVGEVIGDSDPPPGLAVVQQRFDETGNADAKAASITDLTPSEGDRPKLAAEHFGAQLGIDVRTDGLVDHEIFESIYNSGKLLLLATWRDAAAAGKWTPRPTPHLGTLRHRRVRIIRDYGMTDRAEAPQFYPEVRRAKIAAAE